QAIDFAVANGENAAGGKGIDPDAAEELFDAGIDVLTSGNHIWRHRRIIPLMEAESALIRPANFPPGDPGCGWVVRAARDGTPVGVLNLIGRAFMANYDCPFRTADVVLDALALETRVIVVDMHAEATSEKVAMGWHLAGRVSLVVGSHTHVQTADERVLP